MSVQDRCVWDCWCASKIKMILAGFLCCIDLYPMKGSILAGVGATSYAVYLYLVEAFKIWWFTLL